MHAHATSRSGRSLVLTAAILAAAATAPRALARRGAPGPMHRPPPLEHVLGRHADELGLDAETLGRAVMLAEEGREAAEPLRRSVREAHGALRALVESRSVDEAALRSGVEAVADAEASLHLSRLETMLRIRSLLTEEQLDALDRLREQRAERRAGRGPGPGPDPGPGDRGDAPAELR